MKRFAAFLLACTVLFCAAAPAYAVEYVESPGKKIIIIEGGENLMLVTTPIECVSDALNAEINRMLERARAQIAAAEDLSELTPEIIPALEMAKAESDDPRVKALTVKDLIVIDLFDVSLIKNRTEFVHSDPGKDLTFSVKTDLKPGDIFFILHNYEGSSWELLDRWDLADDGVLLIAVDGLSPFAIAVPKYKGQAIDLSGPVSPQTDDRIADTLPFYPLICGIAALFLVCGAAVTRKRNLI